MGVRLVSSLSKKIVLFAALFCLPSFAASGEQVAKTASTTLSKEQCRAVLSALNYLAQSEGSLQDRNSALSLAVAQILPTDKSITEFQTLHGDPVHFFDPIIRKDAKALPRILGLALNSLGLTSPIAKANYLNQLFWTPDSTKEIGQAMRTAFLAKFPRPDDPAHFANVRTAERFGFTSFADFLLFVEKATPASFAAWLRYSFQGPTGSLLDLHDKQAMATAIGVNPPRPDLLKVPFLQTTSWALGSPLLAQIARFYPRHLELPAEYQVLEGANIIHSAIRESFASAGISGKKQIGLALFQILRSEEAFNEFAKEVVVRIAARFLADDRGFIGRGPVVWGMVNWRHLPSQPVRAAYESLFKGDFLQLVPWVALELTSLNSETLQKVVSAPLVFLDPERSTLLQLDKVPLMKEFERIPDGRLINFIVNPLSVRQHLLSLEQSLVPPGTQSIIEHDILLKRANDIGRGTVEREGSHP